MDYHNKNKGKQTFVARPIGHYGIATVMLLRKEINEVIMSKVANVLRPFMG